MQVTIWNEGRHEQGDAQVQAIYPRGIHGCLAGALKELEDLDCHCATLDQPEQGLPAAVLDRTDVLVWWGHLAHNEVDDALADRVRQRVLGGMGLVALHSAHHSKPFMGLMGTSCNLRWRHGDRERLWCTAPGHPIARGVPEYIDLPQEEMYGEYFDIPAPGETVFLGWFAGGEVFRSGLTFVRGRGRIFYFQPGHEEYPVYHDPHIQRIIANAVRWAAPDFPPGPGPATSNPQALEPWKPG